jgi:putative tryptophan/tyrosine transport system substrate-binding protein
LAARLHPTAKGQVNADLGAEGDRLKEGTMRRRKFISLVGGAMAWPIAASAQQRERLRSVGVLMGIAEGDADAQPRANAFQQGLQDLGWIEGQNIRTAYRWAAADPERIRAHAVELVASAPEVILANTTPVAVALQQATRNIPIVFVQVVDPIGPGLVASLARPGGNITGYVIFDFSMGGKWLETLKTISSGVARAGIVYNPDTAPFGPSFARVIDDAAPSLAVEAVHIPVHTAAELEGGVAEFAAKPGGGLIILPDLFNTSHRDAIIDLAARYRLPAVYPFRYFAESGGLISDGVDPLDIFRRSATYVDRILKGANPGELPVQQPSKFELVINLKTARSLGIRIPPTLLDRADDVIE